MPNEFGFMQLLGLFQSEGTTVLALLVIGAIYFLAPAVGYVSSKRGTLLAAMWALIIKVGIGLWGQPVPDAMRLEVGIFFKSAPLSAARCSAPGRGAWLRRQFRAGSNG